LHPISKRLKAFIVDSFMLLMPIFYIVFYLVFGSRQGFAEHMVQGWLLVLTLLLSSPHSFFHARGQTPGYKAYDIILIDLTHANKKPLYIT
jgi:hypothetical protein